MVYRVWQNFFGFIQAQEALKSKKTLIVVAEIALYTGMER